MAGSSAAGGWPSQFKQPWEASQRIYSTLLNQRSTLAGILYPEWFIDLDNWLGEAIGAIREGRQRGDQLQRGEDFVKDLDHVIGLVHGVDRVVAKETIKKELKLALAEPCPFHGLLLPLYVAAEDLIFKLGQAYQMISGTLAEKRLAFAEILNPTLPPLTAHLLPDPDLDVVFGAGVSEPAVLELQEANRVGVVTLDAIQRGYVQLRLLQKHHVAAETKLGALVSMVQGRNPVSARIALQAYALGLKFQPELALPQPCLFLDPIPQPMNAVDGLIFRLAQHYQITSGMLVEKRIALVGILNRGYPNTIPYLVVDPDLDAIFLGRLAVSESSKLELQEARRRGTITSDKIERGMRHLELLERHRVVAERQLGALISLVRALDLVFARTTLRAYVLGLNFHL